ncbi:protein kinase domain protein [Ichthyophthirius multifiliis]|uniref:non-specific serine/threonine protein kinase n=1 Tax=Ichthyophthirius multifiliis TaxID=5932 RepID=G0QVM7_ICHMU|nr:protein kinase domain protein [Ichthyophthirius multifiliis]EGR30714.1 protein kinase domain protein [Ichthyophthirius multifiliis]|eukprot:XP_004032301.1 protein kinase domain protein [Ichthyophthirius multifiliis]
MSKQKVDYLDKYEEIKQIGQGTQGSAILILNKKTKKQYIAKQISLNGITERDSKQAFQELKLLKLMKHPNIVKFIESYLEKERIIIIMEYCELGDLQKLIKEKDQNKQTFNENQIWHWFIDLAQALKFIHQKRVLHRDIKSSNIFITKNNRVKIGDFGISKQLSSTFEHANSLVGTPYYLSPEICQNKPYTYKSDIWALGCIIFELCALKPPFQSNSLMSLISIIVNEQPAKISYAYSQSLQNFIKSMLKKVPEQRPSANDILKNQIIQNTMEQFLFQNNKQYQQKKQTKQSNVNSNEQTKPQIQTQLTDTLLSETIRSQEYNSDQEDQQFNNEFDFNQQTQVSMFIEGYLQFFIFIFQYFFFQKQYQRQCQYFIYYYYLQYYYFIHKKRK